MRLKNLVAPALAVVVVLASNLASVSAQEREQGGRRGGRPEGGRPEGGRPEGGRPEGGRFGGPGGFGQGGPGSGDQVLIMLLSREQVREELKLDPEQIEGLRKLAERLRPERPDFDFRTASEAERTQFVAKMREDAAKRAAETRDQLEVLLLPNQFERLEQIALQVQGPMALVNPEVAQKVGLSKEETESMAKEVQASNEKSREMMSKAVREGSFDGIREKAQAMRQELEEKLISQLSSEQKAKFEELKGPKFDLPEMGAAFGRGPGGPGGFGGRRGGEGEGRDGERRGGEGRRGGDRQRGE